MKAVLATNNPDKAREIHDVLRAAGVTLDLLPRPSDVPGVDETGRTLEENARLKAIALCDVTGLPALADDTGLEVDALGGAPGVHSARFAGDDATYADNVNELLAALRGVPEPGRTARFVTVAIVRWPDGHELVARGEVEGIITDAPHGREGFGYDPVFIPVDGDGRTFAEMTSSEKHEVSHRGRAFRSLATALQRAESSERPGTPGDRLPE